jgi:hypothetical protein
MLYPRQDWFHAIPFQMLLELTIPFSVIMNAMSTELGTMIKDQLSHGAEPPDG